MSVKKDWIAPLALLFVSFIWGATFVVVQNAMSFVGPFTFNGIRFLFAGIILLFVQMIFSKKTSKQDIKQSSLAGLTVGFFLCVGYVLQTFGLLYTTSSKAGFLTGLSIVMVPILSFIFLKQKATIFIVIGIAVATAGLYLLTAGDSFQLNIGDILVLGCAVAFAAHILVNGFFSKKISPLLLSTSQVLAVGMFSSICAFLFEDWEKLFSVALWTNSSFLFALFLTSLFATSIAFFIQTSAQKHTSPTRVAIIFAMEPVFAALTGVLVANEQLSISAIIGCLCIFLGMVFVELPSKTKKEAQAA
ncbi:EamA/RhaT family transporter [Bacillus anthracis]|uniref:EamA/RhaT family transporter n=1 Tax=Bacillus cereus TaxID=1396 RepID=A0A2B1IPI9_BACCE|nr:MULTISPECIES: DMT family transporter [unclassified Bacillus cereus group]ARO17529.1 EamA family transporter [Bacillus cereus]EAL15319.1 transporter, Drug/metabolite exporter family [Bacillus cereus G9241]EEK45609.1 Transporter, EamA [Bacillus cereus m1293]EEM23367.1 Transporter, EamA [Bacillus thuringiensis serovar tochigiensis BGSC 4Y1]OTX86693.1 EamA family transporter [Bacillus thuringiensis serovar chanpaisis]PDY89051.1 EamA/RhaT family transporter [Bacillus anthracis]PHA10008.1 EamA/